jgi:hypothetical protein
MKGIIIASIYEASFGGSTCGDFYFEDGICTHFDDTSSHLTNYEWDTWRNYDPIGKTTEEVKNDFKNWFNDWSDEFRLPVVYYTLYEFEEDQSLCV